MMVSSMLTYVSICQHEDKYRSLTHIPSYTRKREIGCWYCNGDIKKKRYMLTVYVKKRVGGIFMGDYHNIFFLSCTMIS